MILSTQGEVFLKKMLQRFFQENTKALLEVNELVMSFCWRAKGVCVSQNFVSPCRQALFYKVAYVVKKIFEIKWAVQNLRSKSTIMNRFLNWQAIDF